jgi:hypothetical protein
MIMKGRKAIKVLLVLSLSLLVISGSAQTVVKVSIGNVSAVPGEVITIAIMIEDVTNLGVANINLSYDPSVVHVLSVCDGEFDTGAFSEINNSEGIARIGAFQMQSAGLNEDVMLCEVELKAVGAAGVSSGLKIDISELKDPTPEGNDILADIEEGVFSIIQPETAQTPTPSPSPTLTPTPAPITPELQEELEKSEETTEIPVVINTSKGGLAELTDYLYSKDISYDILIIPGMVRCNATPAVIQELSQKRFVERIEQDVRVYAQTPTPVPSPSPAPAGTPEPGIVSPSPPVATPAEKPMIPGFGILAAIIAISLLAVYLCLSLRRKK